MVQWSCVAKLHCVLSDQLEVNEWTLLPMHQALEVLSGTCVFELVLRDKWKIQALGVYSDRVPSILWVLN